MNLRTPVAASRYAVPLVFAVPVLLACAVPDGPVASTADEVGASDGQPLEATQAAEPPGPPPGPQPCSAEADCVNACPPGSKACTCHQPPHGPKICVPTCAGDGDCPSVPDGPHLVCITSEGICAPPHPPPPRPQTCDSEEDCAEGCPPGSKGCTCHETPHGDTICVPTCSVDADCPALPHGLAMTCLEGGICAPPHPPPPPPQP
ncbi:MAG: hypothetical protein JRI68_03715 [Deltaproteobacteria bacterium]|nr:hypothetical protein [Deltaproteobacteria bacterium]